MPNNRQKYSGFLSILLALEGRMRKNYKVLMPLTLSLSLGAATLVGCTPQNKKSSKEVDGEISKSETILTIKRDMPDVAKTDIPGVVKTDIPDVAKTDIPGVAKTDIPAVVKTDVPAVAKTDIPAVVKTDVPAVVKTDVPGVVKVDVQTAKTKSYLSTGSYTVAKDIPCGGEDYKIERRKLCPLVESFGKSENAEKIVNCALSEIDKLSTSKEVAKLNVAACLVMDGEIWGYAMWYQKDGARYTNYIKKMRENRRKILKAYGDLYSPVTEVLTIANGNMWNYQPTTWAFVADKINQKKLIITQDYGSYLNNFYSPVGFTRFSYNGTQNIKDPKTGLLLYVYKHPLEAHILSKDLEFPANDAVIMFKYEVAGGKYPISYNLYKDGKAVGFSQVRLAKELIMLPQSSLKGAVNYFTSRKDGLVCGLGYSVVTVKIPSESLDSGCIDGLDSSNDKAASQSRLILSQFAIKADSNSKGIYTVRATDADGDTSISEEIVIK